MPERAALIDDWRPLKVIEGLLLAVPFRNVIPAGVAPPVNVSMLVRVGSSFVRLPNDNETVSVSGGLEVSETEMVLPKLKGVLSVTAAVAGAVRRGA